MPIKVPLNFMWADEDVLLEDIQKGISSDMTKWATAFYSHIDTKFELDANLSHPISMSQASKYVLSKSGGVTPDLRPKAEILEAERREQAQLDKQIEDRDKKVEELEKREGLLTALIDTIDREHDDLQRALENATDPQVRAGIKGELARTRQEKTSARTSRERAIAARRAAETVRSRLWEQRHELWQRMDDRAEVISGDRAFRIQMALRYVLEGIGSESRINVIFCRAKISKGKYRYLGEARDPLFEKIEVLPGQFLLWPYAYIIIDLSPGHRKTLAHEVVHLWGHNHPAAQVIYAGIKRRPPLNIGLPTFEEIPGGYFDGTEKDIMNYTREDPEAKDTTMNIYDQVQLKNYLEDLAKK